MSENWGRGGSIHFLDFNQVRGLRTVDRISFRIETFYFVCGKDMCPTLINKIRSLSAMSIERESDIMGS